MFDRMNGIGAHEVIIETPDHDKTLATMSEAEIERVLWAFRERVLDLKRDRRFRYILIFKNHGAAAGASLEHSHSQLIALPIVPAIRARRDRRRAAALRGEGALRLLRHHPAGGDAPAAASFTRTRTSWRWRRTRRGFRSRRGCCRKRHGARFEDAPRHEYESLARMLKAAAAADEPGARDAAVQPDHPQRAVRRRTPRDFYHWHVEIDPEADEGGRLRVGDRVLHQPDVAGRSRAGAARRVQDLKRAQKSVAS